MKEELAKIHKAQSAKNYPDIELEKGEHVVLCMERAKIGEIAIWVGVAAIIIILCIVLISFISSGSSADAILKINGQMVRGLVVGGLAICVLSILAGFAGQYIYKNNRMYITNMRAIQKTCTSLFSHSTNVIDLKRIEDVSYRQNSIIEHIFHYGTLRLSTVGDETTYTFQFLDTPSDEVQTISHLIHERKGKES